MLEKKYMDLPRQIDDDVQEIVDRQIELGLFGHIERPLTNVNEPPNIFEKMSKDATAELQEQEDKRLLNIIETETQRPVGDGHGG